MMAVSRIRRKYVTDGTQYYSILDVADSDISKYTEVELTNDIQKAMEGQQ